MCGKGGTARPNRIQSIRTQYETPKILRSIFSTDSCLQSDNGVITSNKPDYYFEALFERSEFLIATCRKKKN